MEGEESLYRVSRDGLAALPMTPLYYRDPVVLRVDSNAVRSLVRQHTGPEQSAERASPTNSFRAAKGATLDVVAVGRVLAALQQLSADEFVVEDPESLDTWCLAQPRATLTIGLSGQGAIGKSIALGDDAGPDAVFALVRGQNVVFTLKHADRDRLFTPLYLTPPEPAALVEPSATTNRIEAGH